MSKIKINQQTVDITLRNSGLGHGHMMAVITSPLDPEDDWVLEVRPLHPGYIAMIRHPLEGVTDFGWIKSLDTIREMAARVVLGYEVEVAS